MKIEKIEYEECDLTLILRDVKLLNSDIQPYSTAKIAYRVDFPHKYLPCQNYVLQKQIDIIKEIDAWCHTTINERINNLQGYLKIHTDQGVTTFTPPIIEVDHFFNKVELINDGMHRMYFLMKYTNDPCRLIIVDGASCPYYAYPTEWSKVQVLDNYIPENFKKKEHRIKEYKALYRDFNTVFDDPVGKPRGKGKM